MEECDQGLVIDIDRVEQYKLRCGLCGQLCPALHSRALKTVPGSPICFGTTVELAGDRPAPPVELEERPSSMGRLSLAPGVYFRLQLIGFFEGVDSERGTALARGRLAVAAALPRL